MASPIIQVDNLNWQVEQKPILKQISFSLGAGKILGVIGPNGAGKTTLLRCIYGRISNFSGQIQIKHKSNLSYGGRALAQQIAVVSQQTEINGALTVEDIVAMGMLPHKSLFSRYSDHDNHQIFNAITNVGLAEKAQQTFSSLSGGEQQRVLIARALVQGADVLILDEPTNHLDVYFQHQILQLITNLPLTIIMTVHDLNLASHYCDQLLLLKQGELVAFGNNEQVLTPENLSAVFQLPCQIEQNHIRFYPAGSN